MRTLYYPLTAFFLLTAFTLSGCSDAKDETAIPDGTPIQIAPSVERTAQQTVARSGASGLADLSSKSLVLDITQNSGLASDPYNYTGLEYQIVNASTVTFKSGTTNNQPPQWKAYTGCADRSDVTIKAQWPLATTVPADQSGALHTEADFLYYAGKPTLDANQMKFTLKHVNAKIRINLILGTGFEWGTTTTSEQTIQVTTTALQNEAESANSLWKVDANEVPIATGSTGVAYTAHREATPASGQYATFEVIILPQTVADMSQFLKIVAGTKPYYYKHDTTDYKFESGKTYTFNLRIGKDEVELTGGIGVTPWTEENIPNGEGEDESRVQTLAALNTLITANNAQYASDNTFLSPVIYSGNEAIPAETFKGCLWLSRFVLTKNAAIGNKAFSGCNNLTELVFVPNTELSGITDETFDELNTSDVILFLSQVEYGKANAFTKIWHSKPWKLVYFY